MFFHVVASFILNNHQIIKGHSNVLAKFKRSNTDSINSRGISSSLFSTIPTRSTSGVTSTNISKLLQPLLRQLPNALTVGRMVSIPLLMTSMAMNKVHFITDMILITLLSL